MPLDEWDEARRAVDWRAVFRTLDYQLRRFEGDAVNIYLDRHVAVKLRDYAEQESQA